MITELDERVAALPDALREAFGRIYETDVSVGRLELTEAMRPWVARQFGAEADVAAQTVVTVLNRLTLEGALFNPLRARRPSLGGADDAALEGWIAQELAGDTFADPLRDTSFDLFGRIEGRFCISASNIAKCAGWHGLVIFREPHPLRFGRAELRDYLDVARRWIEAAHARDPRAIHPIVMWNCLPKSGATIMHGHMQILLARLPFARTELWRRAAAAYRADCGRAYLDDLAAVHAGSARRAGAAGLRPPDPAAQPRDRRSGAARRRARRPGRHPVRPAARPDRPARPARLQPRAHAAAPHARPGLGGLAHGRAPGRPRRPDDAARRPGCDRTVRHRMYHRGPVPSCDTITIRCRPWVLGRIGKADIERATTPPKEANGFFGGRRPRAKRCVQTRTARD